MPRSEDRPVPVPMSPGMFEATAPFPLAHGAHTCVPTAAPCVHDRGQRSQGLVPRYGRPRVPHDPPLHRTRRECSRPISGLVLRPQLVCPPTANSGLSARPFAPRTAAAPNRLIRIMMPPPPAMFVFLPVFVRKSPDAGSGRSNIRPFPRGRQRREGGSEPRGCAEPPVQADARRLARVRAGLGRSWTHVARRVAANHCSPR